MDLVETSNDISPIENLDSDILIRIFNDDTLLHRYLKTLSRSGTRKAVARKMLLSADDLAAKIELESTAPEERAFCRLCK